MSTIHPITTENIDRMVDRIEMALKRGDTVHMEVVDDEHWEINEGDIVIINRKNQSLGTDSPKGEPDDS